MPIRRLEKARVGYDGYRYQPPEARELHLAFFELEACRDRYVTPAMQVWWNTHDAKIAAILNRNSLSGGPPLKSFVFKSR